MGHRSPVAAQEGLRPQGSIPGQTITCPAFDGSADSAVFGFIVGGVKGVRQSAGSAGQVELSSAQPYAIHPTSEGVSDPPSLLALVSGSVDEDQSPREILADR